jgi:hypothetical protein
MLLFIVQSGSITTGIDLTTELSSLLVGIVTLLVLFAGMITFAAVRSHFAQQAQVFTELAPATMEYRQAA